MTRSDAVLDFCRHYVATHGYAPTRREIGRGCGITSTSVVSYHLAKLKEAGIIDFREGAARTIHFPHGAA